MSGKAKGTSTVPFLAPTAEVPEGSRGLDPSRWPASTLRMVRLDELLPYARNSRTHEDFQIAHIARLIARYGWTNPCLIRPDGTLVAGHARVLAAHRIGFPAELPLVPAMVAQDWTDQEVRAYVIADNQSALHGAGWDRNILREEVGYLAGADFDNTLLGFPPLELGELIDFQGPDETTAPADFVSYDETIETEHQCPRCGYRFSGGKKTAAGSGTLPDQPDDDVD